MQIVKKLLLSIISLIFAIVSLTTSTFAWFSTTTVNYVDGFDLTISSTSSLQISLDGINYYDTLTTEMVNSAIGSKDITLDNVTTKNLFLFTNREGNTAEITRNIDYIALPLWFRCSDADRTALFLDTNVSNIYNYNYVYEHSVNGTYIISNGITLVNDYTYFDSSDVQIKKGESHKYYASQAMRIGTKELNVDNKNLLTPDTRTEEELKKFIFDPSENETRGYGKTYGAYDYFLKKTGSSIKVPSEIPNTIYTLSEFVNPYLAKNNNSLIATFQNGANEDGKTYGYAKIEVYFWLEGWDADCMDGIMYDSILMQLQFKGSNPAL